MKAIIAIILQLLPSAVHAFCASAGKPSLLSSKMRSSSISSTTADDNETKSITTPPINPSSEFGRPLPPKIKSLNSEIVTMVKDVMFDSLFDTTSASLSRSDKLTRSYARFYALETIARMPYFSYLSVLHLYETLSWFRRSDYLKLHFSESWNELHHLLIMEELGGNDRFLDRFVAQHTAFFYYWFVIACYIINPTLAYNLNQAIEEHAFETYNSFLSDFEEELKAAKATPLAKKYYTGSNKDLHLFDAFHICVDNENTRRPKMETLYDVFVAIRDDEAEHVKTMEYLQRQDGDIESCEIYF